MTDSVLPQQAVTNERSLSKKSWIIALAVLTFVMSILSLAHGPSSLSSGQVLAILASPLGIDLPWEYQPAQAAVVLEIRAPRTLLGLLTGAILAIAGATLQGLFRNPLADPALIGISSGAALGAISAIVLGTAGVAAFLEALSLPADIMIPLGAFIGAVGAAWVVYQIAGRGPHSDIATLLLAGVAITALANAVIGLLTYMADDEQLRDLTFWGLGSLGGVTWDALMICLPLIVIPAIILMRQANALNALILGEAEAGHLGYRLETLKPRLLMLTALGIGSSVAITGIIGFVGLVVPHLIRLSMGPDHRHLMPAAALLGASMLLFADMIARQTVSPAELPIGIVTAFIGGPFFLWLLIRRQRHQES